jgi:D-alanyl-D-alanine carboxypeptidase/D-alanyl-D-alanine-endopeptidase (penicillin-binding protein 4)
MARSRAWRLWPLVALLLVALPAQAAALPTPVAPPTKPTLDSRIRELLADPDVARGFWGIEVVSVATGKTLYSRNADHLFTPASNTKLFTTAAVLALVGPDYRFHTTVESSATLDKYGRLNGDLVLVGRGDPNLSGRTLPYNLKTERKPPYLKALEALADQVAEKGVKYIDGDVVADDSYYAFERYGEGWAQDDLTWEYGAPVSALTVNDNVLFLTVMPGDRAGEKAFVTLEPFPDYYRLDNRILTTPAGSGPRRFALNRQPGADQLTLWGSIPADDPGVTESVAMEDPASFAAQLFRRMLERRGVAIYGRARARHSDLAGFSTISVTAVASAGGGPTGSAAPIAGPRSMVLAGYDSQPLSEDLRVINKVSQNLHAELALRLLGREKGSGGTIEGGLDVVRAFLATVGLKPQEYSLYDGSGLSRQNLVTPHAVVELLRYAAAQPWFARYRDTLPTAGVDGSLAERFKGTPAAGNLTAKTGSLGHVNVLSGYAKTVKGELVAFSVMSNNHNLTDGRAISTIDQIVLAIVDDETYPTAAAKK